MMNVIQKSQAVTVAETPKGVPPSVVDPVEGAIPVASATSGAASPVPIGNGATSATVEPPPSGSTAETAPVQTPPGANCS